LQGTDEIDKAETAMKLHRTIFAIVLMGFCSSSSSAQEKVIVSHSARAALSIGPLLYGIERGFYRDEGIDLVYVSLRADLGIKALLSGDIDYCYSTGTIIRGAILGLPVRNLTFDFSRVLHALMSRPDIPNAAALKGKIVGVSSFGATGDLAARVGLRALGLDPDKDVTIITLGTDTLRHAALIAGTVQATHMPVPLNIQLKKQGFHELVYGGKILQRPLTGLLAFKLGKGPCRVNDSPPNHRQQRLQRADLILRHGEIIRIEHCQVGELADFDRAFAPFFESEPGAADGEKTQRFFAREILAAVAQRRSGYCFTCYEPPQRQHRGIITRAECVGAGAQRDTRFDQRTQRRRAARLRQSPKLHITLPGQGHTILHRDAAA
jgi:NMT1/THI5 like